MKPLFIALLVIMFSCCLNCPKVVNHEALENNNRNDTTVVVKLISPKFGGTNYTEKELFVCVGCDTSNLSCILSVRKDDSMLIVDLRRSVYDKKYQTTEDTDTSSIINHDSKGKVRYDKLIHEEFSKEMKMIFEKVSQDYDLSKLKCIRFSVLIDEPLAIDVTNQYQNDKKTIKHFDYEIVDNYIFNSRLLHEINQIIGVYSMTVEGVDIEMPSFVSKKCLFDRNSEFTPNEVLDFMVLLYLKRIAPDFPAN
jgi:hypothetical protein